MPMEKTIARWFDDGVAQNASHMIVMCDTADLGDYAVYAKDPADAIAQHAELRQKPMQTVMEVYDLADDKDAQMSEHRCMRLPT